MFKYFEPNKIFSVTSRAPRYVLFLFIIIISIGLTEALILSPEDYKQSHSVRIMYVHVPAAWISLGIFSSISKDSGCRIPHIPNLGILISDVRPFLSEFTVWWCLKFPLEDFEDPPIPKFQEPTVFDSNLEPSSLVICRTGFDLNRVYRIYEVFR